MAACHSIFALVIFLFSGISCISAVHLCRFHGSSNVDEEESTLLNITTSRNFGDACQCPKKGTEMEAGFQAEIQAGSIIILVSVNNKVQVNSSEITVAGKGELCAWNTSTGAILDGRTENCTFGQICYLVIEKATGNDHSGDWTILTETNQTENGTNTQEFHFHINVIDVPLPSAAERDGRSLNSSLGSFSRKTACLIDGDCKETDYWCRVDNSTESNRTKEQKICQPICSPEACGENSKCLSAHQVGTKQRICKCKDGFYEVSRSKASEVPGSDCFPPVLSNPQPIISWISGRSQEETTCKDNDMNSKSSAHQGMMVVSPTTRICPQIIHIAEERVVNFTCKLNGVHPAPLNARWDFLDKNGDVIKSRTTDTVLEEEGTISTTTRGMIPSAYARNYTSELSYKMERSNPLHTLRCIFNVTGLHGTMSISATTPPIKAYACSNVGCGKVTRLSIDPQHFVRQGSPLNLSCSTDLPLLTHANLSDCSWSLTRGGEKIVTFKFFSKDPTKVAVDGTLNLGSGAWNIRRVIDVWTPNRCNVQIEKAGLEAQGNWSCSVRFQDGKEAHLTKRKARVVVVAPATVTMEVDNRTSNNWEIELRSRRRQPTLVSHTEVLDYHIHHNETEDPKTLAFLCHAKNAAPAPRFRWFVWERGSKRWIREQEEHPAKELTMTTIAQDYTSKFTYEFNTEGRREYHLSVQCEVTQYVQLKRKWKTDEETEAAKSFTEARVALHHGPDLAGSPWLYSTVVLCLGCLAALAIWAICSSETLKDTRQRCMTCFRRRERNRRAPRSSQQVNQKRSPQQYTYSPRPVSRKQSLRDKERNLQLEQFVEVNLDDSNEPASPDPTLGRSMSLIPSLLTNKEDCTKCLNVDEGERRCSCDVHL